MPMHLQPFYEGERRFPHSERFGGVGLNLPTHFYLDREDVRVICAIVAAYFKEHDISPLQSPAWFTRAAQISSIGCRVRSVLF